MKLFSLPGRWCYKLYGGGVFLIATLITYPVYKVLFIRKSGFGPAFKLMRIHSRLLLSLLFIRIKKTGPVPRLPEGPFMICANHSSFLDTPCIYALFPSYFTFIGKEEIRKWPLFRIFYTSGMNILVDRNSRSSGASALRRMMHELDSGHSLAVFPEGTISRSAPHPGPFKKGVLSAAIKKQVPVVPVVFLNNYQRFQRKSFLTGMASPGIAKVIILEPVITAGLTISDLPRLEAGIHQMMKDTITAGKH